MVTGRTSRVIFGEYELGGELEPIFLRENIDEKMPFFRGDTSLPCIFKPGAGSFGVGLGLRRGLDDEPNFLGLDFESVLLRLSSGGSILEQPCWVPKLTGRKSSERVAS